MNPRSDTITAFWSGTRSERSDCHFCLSYSHPGDNPSCQSFAAWIPGYAASIVILANDETANIQDLLRQLL
jgi:hypothetical protein